MIDDPSAVPGLTAGIEAGQFPRGPADAAGRTLTTASSRWLGIRCGKCQQTFRRGDMVLAGAGLETIRHLDPRLRCGPDGPGPAGGVTSADAPARDTEDFVRGLLDEWPPITRVPVYQLTEDDWQVTGPHSGPDSPACRGCGHTFRPGDYVGCLDSRQARLELLSRCALADARLVDGGTGPWSGEIRIRTDPDSACWACSLTAWERGVSEVPRSCAEIQPAAQEPASIALTALTASWMTVAAVRLLLGLALPYRALRVEAAAGTTTQVAFTRDPRCLHHQPLPVADLRLRLTPENTVRELLAALPAGSDVQVWSAFPAATRCRSCGTEWRGTPHDHAPLHCGTCGSFIRPRTDQWLSRADASVRLAELGVAPGDILPVRTREGIQRWLRLSG